MARRAFFSFHYQKDIFRANVVRNHWITQRDSNKKYNTRLFWDGSLWEEVKRKGVYIGQIKNIYGNAGVNGPNPFNYVSFPNAYPTYYWYTDRGYENFSDWVEQAAIEAGR